MLHTHGEPRLIICDHATSCFAHVLTFELFCSDNLLNVFVVKGGII